ncbi:MAG: hypothetical protein ABI836_02400 [Gemmatimonadota bacterium]
MIVPTLRRASRTIWIVAALLVAFSMVASACKNDSNAPNNCQPGDPGYPECLD